MTESSQGFIVRIVDDDPAIHDSLSMIFDLAGISVRHYFSAEEFLASDFLSDSGCAVLDLRMNGMSGLELQQKLNSKDCSLPLIFLSGHGDIDIAVSAMQEGAVTFLTKPVAAAKLMEAVDRARAKLKPDDEAERIQKAVDSLSEREQDVFRLLRQGLSCRAAADRLGITLRTAEVHRTGIARKLNCSGARELDALLKRLG